MKNINDDPWEKMLTQGATFMKQHRDYFLRAFQSTGQNSFREFWYHDSLNNVEKEIERRSARNKLSKKEVQAAKFFTAGYTELMRDWLEEGTPTSPLKKLHRQFVNLYQKSSNLICGRQL